jgi:hypothetical protein
MVKSDDIPAGISAAVNSARVKFYKEIISMLEK